MSVESRPISELSSSELSRAKEREVEQRRSKDFIYLFLDEVSRNRTTPRSICEKFRLDYTRQVYPTLRALKTSGYVEIDKTITSCPTCGRRLTHPFYILTKRGKNFLKRYQE